MHALHCILVQLLENHDDYEEMTKEARCLALDATEHYSFSVFDWRESDAGRWARHYPRRGVVLGAENRELFLELLEAWKDRPLTAASNYLEMSSGDRWAWRTEEELARDGAVVFPNPLNGQDGKYWSAVPVALPVLDKNLLQDIWEGKCSGSWVYNLAQALRLVDGNYVFDSQFYSVPDGSARIEESTLQDARENPEWYALVFLDYHF